MNLITTDFELALAQKWAQSISHYLNQASPEKASVGRFDSRLWLPFRINSLQCPVKASCRWRLLTFIVIPLFLARCWS
jgi:hypothetical protein